MSKNHYRHATDILKAHGFCFADMGFFEHPDMDGSASIRIGIFKYHLIICVYRENKKIIKQTIDCRDLPYPRVTQCILLAINLYWDPY